MSSRLGKGALGAVLVAIVAVGVILALDSGGGDEPAEPVASESDGAGEPAADSGSDASQPVSGGEAETSSLLVIMDASGSMKQRLDDGRSRIAAAKRALRELAAGLPEGAEVGLRVFGNAAPKGCRNTDLVSPVEPLDRERLNAAIGELRAKGKTPIGLSLRQAGADLPKEGERAIVLVSDGKDSCAPPDPCEVAKDLKAKGIDVRIDTVGFALGDDEGARRQLQCIAEAGGGEFHDVDDAEELGETLSEVAEGPSAECPAAAALGDDGEWAGGWDDSRYWREGETDMILGQSGDRVEGCFSQSGYSYDQALITGTVSGQTLSGRWGIRSFEEAEAGEPGEGGDFEFTLSDGGSSFTGRIEFDDYPESREEWNGTRVEENAP